MRTKIKTDNLIIFLAAVYFAACSFTMATDVSGYIMLASSILVVLFSAWQTRGTIQIKVGIFHVITFSFVLYCLSSALWATDATYVFGYARPLLLNMIMMYMLYIYFTRKPVEYMLRVAMLGSYMSCLVALAYQGVDTYIQGILNSVRISDNSFLHANFVGALAARGLLINIFYILYYKKIRWWMILSLPALLCLGGAESKRSILTLFGGIFILFILKNYNRKKVMTSLAKILLAITALLVAAFFLKDTPLLRPVMERFEDTFKTLNNLNYNDGSVWPRIEMIKIGIELFKKSPLFGIGINNARLYNTVLHGIMYLHSNMAELLSGGGLIGFGLYYSMHSYILYNMWKYRKYKTDECDILFAIILLYLVFDVGDMSYEQKETYFYFMASFIEIKHLKSTANMVRSIQYTKHLPYIEKIVQDG